MRILKRDTEKTNDVMTKCYNQPLQKDYICWNKSNEEFEEENYNYDQKAALGLDRKIFLTQRQKEYLENCTNDNVTQKCDDMKEYIFLEFENDIYCITFIKFMTSNDALLHRELMLKCVLTFAF